MLSDTQNDAFSFRTTQNEIIYDVQYSMTQNDSKQINYIDSMTLNNIFFFRTTQNKTFYIVQYSTTQNNSKQTNYCRQNNSKRCIFLQNNSKQDYLHCTVQYDSKQLKTRLE